MRIVAALFFVVCVNSAMACGTVKWAVDGIYGQGPMAFANPDDLFQSLANTGGACRNLSDRQPQENQQRLMSLLLDESLRDLTLQYGDAILTVFQCLAEQSSTIGYAQLKQQYPASACFEVKPNKVFFVSALNGGNLRMGAGVQGRKLTTLKKGTQVKELDRTGKWVKVEVVYRDPRRIPKCKYSSPCQQGYIHANLLHP